MDSPKKEAENLNVLWVLTFTLMGGAFIYASFVGLQALYLSDANKIEMRQKANGQRLAYDALVKTQTLSEYKTTDGKIQVPLDKAKELVLADIRGGNPSALIPAVGASNQPTVPAVYGRPPDNVKMPAPVKPAPPAPPTDVPVDGANAAPEGLPGVGAGPGAGPNAGAGAANPATPPAGAPKNPASAAQPTPKPASAGATPAAPKTPANPPAGGNATP